MNAIHAMTGMGAKYLAVTLAALALGLSAQTGAAAQGTGPCAEDVAKLCSDVRPGGGRIARCLKANKSEITQACKDHLGEAGEKVQEVSSACEDDTFKFCKHVRAGRGRLLRCLKRHQGELSEACNAKVGQARTDEQL